MMPKPQEIFDLLEKRRNEIPIDNRAPPFIVLVEEQLEVFLAAFKEVNLDKEIQYKILDLCQKYYNIIEKRLKKG